MPCLLLQPRLTRPIKPMLLEVREQRIWQEQEEEFEVKGEDAAYREAEKCLLPPDSYLWMRML